MIGIAVQLTKIGTVATPKITSMISSSMEISMIAAAVRTCISRTAEEISRTVEEAGRTEKLPTRITSPRMSSLRINKSSTRWKLCRMAVTLATECTEATSINNHMADRGTKTGNRTTATITGTTNNSKSRSLSSSTGNNLHMSSHPSTQARTFQTSILAPPTIHRTAKELSTVSTRTR